MWASPRTHPGGSAYEARNDQPQPANADGSEADAMPEEDSVPVDSVQPMNAAVPKEGSSRSSHRSAPSIEGLKSSYKLSVPFNLTELVPNVVTLPRRTALSRVKIRGLAPLPRSKQQVQEQCQKLLDATWFSTIIVLLTVWAIFGEDIATLTLNEEADAPLGILNIVIAWVFVFELVLNVVATPDYVWSVYAVLDVLSILSMFFTASMIEKAYGGGNIARTGRAAKVGAKAGRIIKAARFLRLGRLIMAARKIHDRSQARGAGGQLSRAPSKVAASQSVFVESPTSRRESVFVKRSGSFSDEDEEDEEEDEEKELPANCMSGQLSTRLTIKMVIVIFLMLLVLPLLEVPEPTNGDVRGHSVLFVEAACTESGPLSAAFNLTTAQFMHEYRDRLFFFKSCGISLLSKPGSAPTRENHMSKLGPGTGPRVVFQTTEAVAKFNDEGDYFQEAKMSLAFISVVLALLVFSSFEISRAATEISEMIAKPVKQICRDMSTLRSLKFSPAFIEDRGMHCQVYEAHQLQDAFQRMKLAIVSFAHYVPKAIVKDLLNTRGSMADVYVEKRNITVFFSDIQGFTTICEMLEPEQIIVLLTEYFNAMEEIVRENKGAILEYVGDAILAVWNAPVMVSEHAKRCLLCSTRMQLRLEQLRDDWICRGFPEIRIRIGVHTANVFHGNIGSHARLKYGVLGDGVNLASRLEELNKRYSSEILCTQDTYHSDGVAETFLLRPVDVVVVKGKSKPSVLWEVVCPMADADTLTVQLCELQTRAFHHFMNREFDQATKLLEKAHELEEDHKDKRALDPTGVTRICYGTLRYMRSRSEKLSMSPPPPDWDGAEILHEKHF